MATTLSIKSPAQLPLTGDCHNDFIRIGVLGYGYWGPNIVRNFHGQEKSRVVTVCDQSPKALGRVRQSQVPQLALAGGQAATNLAQRLRTPR